MSNKVTLIVVKKGLTYEQAEKALREEGAYITRPVWQGYHFRYFEHYCIRLASGEILVDPEEIYDKDAKDWMIVKYNNYAEDKAVHKKLMSILK